MRGERGEGVGRRADRWSRQGPLRHPPCKPPAMHACRPGPALGPALDQQPQHQRDAAWREGKVPGRRFGQRQAPRDALPPGGARQVRAELPGERRLACMRPSMHACERVCMTWSPCAPARPHPPFPLVHLPSPLSFPGPQVRCSQLGGRTQERRRRRGPAAQVYQAPTKGEALDCLPETSGDLHTQSLK
jgi:hypothetical protein